MKNRKVFLYYFLSMVMVLFPILNLLSFVPMVILYKKSNFRTYILSVAALSLLSLFIFSSFTVFIPILISFIFIKGMDMNKEGYKILVCSSFVMMILIVGDFLIIKLDSKSYEIFLESFSKIFNNFENYKETLNITNTNDFINKILNIYPAISFGISYIFCIMGYLLLSKRAYEFNRNSDDIIIPFDINFFIFSILIIFFMSISNMNNGEIFYKIFFICYNLIIALIEILMVQGFIKFNTFLKENLGKIVANIISFLSIFFIVIYLVYFICGLYNSIMRGIKWRKN